MSILTREPTTQETEEHTFQGTIAVQISTRATDRAEAVAKLNDLRAFLEPHVTNGFRGSVDQWDLALLRDMQTDGPSRRAMTRPVYVKFEVQASSPSTRECAVTEMASMASGVSQQTIDRPLTAPSRAAAEGVVEASLEQTTERYGTRMNQGTIAAWEVQRVR